MNNTCGYDVIESLARVHPWTGVSAEGLRGYVDRFLGDGHDVQIGPDFIGGYLSESGLGVRVAMVTLSWGKFGAQEAGRPSVYVGETVYLGDPTGQILPGAYIVLVNSVARGIGAGHYYLVADESLREDVCAGLVRELLAEGNLRRVSV